MSHFGFANEMMQVINAQNVLITKLLQRQNLLYQELNKRFSSSGSSSESADKSQKGPKVSGYRELNNQDVNSSGSPPEVEGCEVRTGVKIIHGENKVVPHVPKNIEFV